MIVETGDLRPIARTAASRLDAAARRGRRRPHHRDGWRRRRVPARWTRRRGCRQARRLGAGRRRHVRRARRLAARQPARELRGAALALARARLRCRARQAASRTGSTACSPMARRRSPTAATSPPGCPARRRSSCRPGPTSRPSRAGRCRPPCRRSPSSSAAEIGTRRWPSPTTFASSPPTKARPSRRPSSMAPPSGRSSSRRGRVDRSRMRRWPTPSPMTRSSSAPVRDVVGSLLATHRGSSSLATDAEVGRLVAALPSPRIGLAVVDTGPLFAALRARLGPISGVPNMTTTGRVAEALSLEADRVVATAASLALQRHADDAVRAAGGTDPGRRARLRDAAEGGRRRSAPRSRACSRALGAPTPAPPTADWRAAFEDAVGFPLADLFSWADDGAAYVTAGAGAPSGGLVLLTADPSAAGVQLAKLTDALVRMAHDEGTAAGGDAP